MPPEFLIPEWPASARVRAACTLRAGGASSAPFDSLNLGAHVGDDPAAVAENRRRVAAALALPAEPLWLEQVHGTAVAEAGTASARTVADAVLARSAGEVAVIQVADCMPVLFADRAGTAVAAAHAGWRGLAAGVLEATVRALALPPERLLAWLGPAIGPEHFEVGGEVRAAFVAKNPAAERGFSANERGRWQCDLGELARQRLAALGISAVYGGSWCTFADRDRFFSYRRDGRCGRMGALIWLV